MSQLLTFEYTVTATSSHTCNVEELCAIYHVIICYELSVDARCSLSYDAKHFANAAACSGPYRLVLQRILLLLQPENTYYPHLPIESP